MTGTLRDHGRYRVEKLIEDDGESREYVEIEFAVVKLSQNPAKRPPTILSRYKSQLEAIADARDCSDRMPLNTYGVYEYTTTTRIKSIFGVSTFESLESES